jgi:predicted nucleotidyltransferase
MRITEPEINNIKQSVLYFDKNAKLYLFGSRTDDSKKGGDIDIAIISDAIGLKEKVKIKLNFFNQFEEQKIDILTVTSKSDNLFWDVVKQNAIQL